MSQAMLRILVRVIKRRYEERENIDDILGNYNLLTEADYETIKNNVIPPAPEIPVFVEDESAWQN